jgi:HAD superfamily hydrolase (TIGR01549 family)
MNKYKIFDFDGTIIDKMEIDYIKLKKELQNILQSDHIDFMYESIKNSKNENIKNECYRLIDTYELDALNNAKIKKDIMDMYLNSFHKIIVSRNGSIPILSFFKNNNLTLPDFISCRDNCLNLKPHTEQIDIIFNYFNELNKDNIILIGDSWHDIELAKNIGCEYMIV